MLKCRSYKFSILTLLTLLCLLVLLSFHYNVVNFLILRPRHLKMIERRNKNVLRNVFKEPVHTEPFSDAELYSLLKNFAGIKSNTKELGHRAWNKSDTKDILWFNKPNYINLTFANKALQSSCIYTNCRMYEDETNIDRFAAVVFSITEPLDSKPPVTPSQRNPNQIWIFFTLEPPIDRDYLSYNRIDWINTMNWSMSYETDSDVFFPYGMLETRKETKIQKRYYGDIFRSKTKQVAWIVSHCGAPSRRDEYVNELKKFGVDVEIFGKCGNRYIRNREHLSDYINKNFKFLLSFENSFCEDYISEKFFSYYNLDVILVVRGGADYDRLLPVDIFINSAHFISPKSLADYLLKVGASEKLFTEYLKNKDKFNASDLFSMPTGYCNICKKLNKMDGHRITYVDHIAYRHNNSCWEPNDVTFSRSNLIVLLLVIFIVLFLIAIRYTYRKVT